MNEKEHQQTADLLNRIVAQQKITPGVHPGYKKTVARAKPRSDNQAAVLALPMSSNWRSTPGPKERSLRRWRWLLLCSQTAALTLGVIFFFEFYLNGKGLDGSDPIRLAFVELTYLGTTLFVLVFSLFFLREMRHRAISAFFSGLIALILVALPNYLYYLWLNQRV